MTESVKRERLIRVCAACLRASCWHFEFMCDDAVDGGAVCVTKPESELDALGLESPDRYSRERVEYFGCTIEQTPV